LIRLFGWIYIPLKSRLNNTSGGKMKEKIKLEKDEIIIVLLIIIIFLIVIGFGALFYTVPR